MKKFFIILPILILLSVMVTPSLLAQAPTFKKLPNIVDMVKETRAEREARQINADLVDGNLYQMRKAKLGETMNFEDCLNYKVGVCTAKCGIFPLPGIKLSYQEPTALIESVCVRDGGDVGGGAVNSLVGAKNSDDEPACVKPVELTKSSDLNKYYYDAHVWGISKFGRFQSSGSPIRVALSYTCEAAKIVNTISKLYNMDISNFKFSMGSFDMKAVMNGITNGVKNGISNAMKALTNLPAKLIEGVSNIPSLVGKGFEAAGEQLTNGMIKLENALENGINKLGQGLQDISNFKLGDVLTDIEIKSVQDLGAVLSSTGRTLAIAGMVAGDEGMMNMGGAMALAGGGMSAIGHMTEKLNKLDIDKGLTDIKQGLASIATGGLVGGAELMTAISSGAALTGVTQVTSAVMSSSFLETTSSILAVGALALALTDDVKNSSDPEKLCSAQKAISEAKETVTTAQAIVNVPGYEGGAYLAGTYLPDGFNQTVKEGEMIASCPLTHAGYVLETKDDGLTYDRRYVNCYKCSGEECSYGYLPNAGFVGTETSCEKNQLSSMQEDGFYLACNGYGPAKADDRQPVPPSITPVYRAELDHLKQLNDKRTQQLQGVTDKAVKDVLLAEQTINNNLTQTGGSCDTFGQPIGFWGMPKASVQAASVIMPGNTPPPASLPPPSTWINPDKGIAPLSLGKDDGNGMSGDSSTNIINDLSSAISSVESMEALLQSGGLMNKGKSMIAKLSPFGIYTAWRSEDTQWAKPPFSVTGKIKQIFSSVVHNTPLWLLCSVPTLAKDYGVMNLAPLNSLNTTICGEARVWGPVNPQTGHVFDKNKTRGAALIMVRAKQRAEKLNNIPRNSKGLQQFNLDYPHLYKEALALKNKELGKNGALINTGGKTSTVVGAFGGKHKGSGCYDIGTSKGNWYTPGEENPINPFSRITSLLDREGRLPAPNFESEVDNGYYVFTTWKKTACCLVPCGIKPLY